MTIPIILNSQSIHQLDLSPAQKMIDPILEEGAITDYEQKINFEVDYPCSPEDPRELSEIPEIRLWFIRVDAYYPWLPYLLDWKGGELARYTAMLVPHQFHPTEGIQYNPEALEIFLMSKIFTLTQWLKQQSIPSTSKLKAMSQILGYDLDEGLFELIAAA